MARRKVKLKPSYLVQPDPIVDKKYLGQDQTTIEAEIARCKNGLSGLKYFINEYIYVPNKIKPEILVDKPTWFQHLIFEKEKINLKLYPKQEEYLECLWANRLVASYKSRQTGVTTITEAFVLQYALFNDNKEIVIISKAEQEAIKFLDAVYYMYNHLPFFLRRQYSKAVKKSFHLGTVNKATKINVLTSTSKSGRSFSATILILDEAEFIDHADDLWAAAQPTLSATGGQAIVISTPWKYKSWFWKVCHGEEDAAFKKFKINWSDIPGRDQEWYDAQCAELHYDRLKIQTELDMEWIIPFQKYYSEEFLDKSYIIKPEDFEKFEKEYGLGIILTPVDGIEYYFGVDTYEGGLDNNAGVVVGSDMRIYAYFKTQRIDVFELVKFLCDFYKTKLCVERNRGFFLIKDFMDRELHKKYILYRLVKRKNIYDEQWCFVTNGENRKKLVTSTSDYLKYVHNWNTNPDNSNDMIKIPEALHEEMNYFVIKGGRVEGVEHDDLIFALIAALYVRDNKSTFYNQKTGQSSNMMGIVNQFYGTVNGASSNSLLANGKVNTIIARNFLAGVGKGKKMTVDQLDMLDKVLSFGKQMIEEKNKTKENKTEEQANEHQI